MEYVIYALWGWAILNGAASAWMVWQFADGRRPDSSAMGDFSKIPALQAIMAMLAIQLLR